VVWVKLCFFNYIALSGLEGTKQYFTNFISMLIKHNTNPAIAYQISSLKTTLKL